MHLAGDFKAALVTVHLSFKYQTHNYCVANTMHS